MTIIDVVGTMIVFVVAVVVIVSNVVIARSEWRLNRELLRVQREWIKRIESEKDGGETMMKAMISQPMAGKTDGEIAETRERAKAELEEMGYEFVNTLFTDEWYSDEAMKERGVVQIPLCFLAKSLENMSLCHAAYFCKGWESARGCRIEHDAAVAYGLDIIYED